MMSSEKISVYRWRWLWRSTLILLPVVYLTYAFITPPQFFSTSFFSAFLPPQPFSNHPSSGGSVNPLISEKGTDLRPNQTSNGNGEGVRVDGALGYVDEQGIGSNTPLNHSFDGNGNSFGVDRTSSLVNDDTDSAPNQSFDGDRVFSGVNRNFSSSVNGTDMIPNQTFHGNGEAFRVDGNSGYVNKEANGTADTPPGESFHSGREPFQVDGGALRGYANATGNTRPMDWTFHGSQDSPRANETDKGVNRAPLPPTPLDMAYNGSSEEAPFINVSPSVEIRDGLGNFSHSSASVKPSDNSNQTGPPEQCNLIYGEWVEDRSYPLFSHSSCPFVDEAFACLENGRPDSDYTHLRWSPTGCQVPRFNATDMLEKFRGKRLAYVGDSLNRNQFESMVCMLYEVVSNKSRVYETHGHQISKGITIAIVMFKDYNFRVEFYQSHYLVQEEKTPINGTTKYNFSLKVDTMDRLESKYRNADIIVFNTGHWWTHGRTARGKNYYREGNKVYPKLPMIVALRKALNTWAEWVQNFIDPAVTRVFWRSYSPAHFRGGQWNSGGQCHSETQPIYNSSFILPYPEKAKIIDDVMRQTKVAAKLLNVTRLSDFRKDAHPSIYGHKLQTGGTYQDCSHWCLPGLPDTWNALLYAHLVKPDFYT